MENELELIVDTEEITAYRYLLLDHKIFLLLDKKTNILYMSCQDMAESLGYADKKDMLSSDQVLDVLSAVKKQTGKFPIDDNLANVTLLRKIPLRK